MWGPLTATYASRERRAREDCWEAGLKGMHTPKARGQYSLEEVGLEVFLRGDSLAEGQKLGHGRLPPLREVVLTF